MHSPPGSGSGAPILRFGTSRHKMILRRHDREGLLERLWRYRGVLAVTGVPLLVLFIVVTAMFPSGARRGGGGMPHHGVSLATSGSGSSSSSSGGKGGGAQPPHVYSVVVDAGSTGSRIHTFKFARGAKGQLRLLSDDFHQLKPGLSAFPDDPAAAAASLKPLLDAALEAVPRAQHASTGLSLKATAGLRLLPGGKADAILAEVERRLRADLPFRIADGAVGVMDGAHEGAFAWLTLNYLLGKLGKGPEATVAAIDLGGGSVQEAFALPAADAGAAPEGYVTQLHAGGAAFNVYVHSYLGYGLMAARAKVIEAGRDDPSHPCFAKGSALKYAYGGKEYAIRETVDAGDFKRCAQLALKALQHDKGCGDGQPQAACSFAGAWRGKPSGMARVYYVSSYFWDRALEAGIIADPKAIEWRTSPAEFARGAAAACGKPAAELAKAFVGLPEAQAPYFCLDLSFCHTVLTEGFDLPASAPVTLVKQVAYEGQTIEAAWPLGAAINDLSTAA